MIWTVLLVGALAGWAVLDGMTQGLGATLRQVGRTPGERRTVLTALGPFLLAGEVWLIAGAGILLAGFPELEKDLWFVAYPLVVALLVTWVLRDAGVWLRSRQPGTRWRAGWERVIVVASVGLPLSAGALLGTALVWLPPQPSLTARVVVPVLTALSAVAVTRVLGTVFVAVRTSGILRERATRLALRTLPWSAGLLAASAIAYVVLVPAGGPLDAVLPPLVVLAGSGSALVARPALAHGRLHRALGAVVAGGVLPVVAAAIALAPVATPAPTLELVLLACVPVLLAAQAWVWWTFRHPVSPRDAVFY
ncbi:cytochrome d ubiquinol oxidase subunit II [Cellulomonas fengjieae]|uniref:cytochrome d ubiquinol oxidase subunit II n=1 Tax=Cellulomonas fengjieae TaxID=2819978 RepID=UPI001AAFF1DB|nr:cytochrome d ubiquinol oxidase subunit II [Cellulomonas fengjieae]MBO3100573.1 cytochrome d ubiquinol oxidase subunit II [Cellulomonas fengjieae]